MGLTLKSLNSESLHDTLSSLTLGNTNAIKALVFFEDFRDLDLLLKMRLSPIELVLDGSSVQLNLHQVSLVLSESKLANLGGANNADNMAVLGNSLDVLLHWSLGSFLVSIGILGESLLLGSSPVLVESSLNILIELLSPNGAKSTHSTGSLDVSNETNDLHWWAFNNGDRVYPISVDQFLTLTSLLNLDDVTHTGLVSAESSKVDLLGCIILWE